MDTTERIARDLIRLQQRLVVRTADYFHRLGELASQGSVEPRAYIEESYHLWSGALDEVGDWLKPRAHGTQRWAEATLPTVRAVVRSERCDCRFSVPIQFFDRLGDNAIIRLSTNGLIRQFNPRQPLGPTVVLEPEQNVRVAPREVSCSSRSLPELKVYGISSLVLPGERYEGVIWGALPDRPAERFAVATVELEIAA